MPELPWEKWYPTNWASEPGLRLCEASTRGIWFEAVNTMMLQQNHFLSGTIEQLAALCICRVPQMQLAISQLKQFNVADVVEQNGNIMLSNRRRKRACKISDLRSLAGKRSAAARNKPSTSTLNGVSTPSASASASASENGSLVDSIPKLEWCLTWLKESRKNGSDYTEAETRSAALALNANGWMWGKNPVVDWRSALERQIQTDRQRRNKPGKKNTPIAV